jgi:protein-L-isoaspartate(D-aspartate) O-methyltransferase
MVTSVPAAEAGRRAGVLRGRLVDGMVADGIIGSAPVERAFRVVPRHMFAPDAELERVYAREIVVVKRDEHGVPVSTVSAPEIQARMLEQAQVGPGMRVMEIGSGGYNAALIAELVGPSGQVTTVDIDPEVADRARAFLTRAGYSRVRVVTGDAEAAIAAHAHYDRIIVTAGAWDIPPAWTDQLAPTGGRIVVPLRMRGITRSLALETAPDGSHLICRSAEVCGFVRIQGVGAHRERMWLLCGDRVGLRFDDGELERPELLDGVLAGGPSAAWSAVVVGRTEPFETLPLWLATVADGFCALTADARACKSGIAVEPGGRWFPYAVADRDSFAYLSTRPSGEDAVEFGAHGYGPRAQEVASALADHVASWDRLHRGGAGPVIAIWPAGTPREQMPSEPQVVVIAKAHRLVTISWPQVGGQCWGALAPG